MVLPLFVWINDKKDFSFASLFRNDRFSMRLLRKKSSKAELSNSFFSNDNQSNCHVDGAPIFRLVQLRNLLTHTFRGKTNYLNQSFLNNITGNIGS